jgi:hypothetical protein
MESGEFYVFERVSGQALFSYNLRFSVKLNIVYVMLCESK